jgi:Arc/MetJ-type ribon-helix-helix transcriptional regulator
MTATAKIAISLPAALAARARRAVARGRAPSVSAYIAAALEDKAQMDDLATMLDEMLAESGGPLTPRERREADRALGIGPGKRKG